MILVFGKKNPSIINSLLHQWIPYAKYIRWQAVFKYGAPSTGSTGNLLPVLPVFKEEPYITQKYRVETNLKPQLQLSEV